MKIATNSTNSTMMHETEINQKTMNKYNNNDETIKLEEEDLRRNIERE